MTNGLIDGKGLDAAVKWSLAAKDRDEQFLKEFGVRQIIEAYLSELPKKKKKDIYLANMVRQVRAYLQENNPVMAYELINGIKKVLEEKGDI